MGMTAEEIETSIKNAIPDAIITIEDLAGDNDHYKATVLSKSFAGLSRIKQHQAVYNALGGMAGTTLHALALTTGVGDE